MTDEQWKHLQSIQYLFNTRVADKYQKGVQEHGGNLWDMPSKDLLDNALDEAIDQVVYLLTLKQTLSLT